MSHAQGLLRLAGWSGSEAGIAWQTAMINVYRASMKEAESQQITRAWAQLRIFQDHRQA